jgi:hypothetical protein
VKETDDANVGINKLILPESLKRYGILENGGVSMRFEASSDGNDIVVCAGQKVKTDFVCNRVYIFGFSAWGRYKEYFHIGFIDGTKQIERIAFSDVCWSVRESTFDNFIKVAEHNNGFADKFITLRGYHCGDKTDMPVNIYVYKVSLPEPKRVTAIGLPDNPFMHVAAITLSNGRF